MLAMITLLCFLLSTTYSHAQVPGIGSCPENVKALDNFDLQAYLGKWYEYERYPFIFEAGGKCTYAEYKSLSKDSISVLNFQINSITNWKSNVTGTAEVKGPGKLLVRFPRMPAIMTGSNYWVLGTDYNSYAVVYSCSDFYKFVNAKIIWILTREAKPSEDVVEKARKVLDDNKLSKRLLLKTNHDNCPVD